MVKEAKSRKSYRYSRVDTEEIKFSKNSKEDDPIVQMCKFFSRKN